ncbi:MAG: ribonuclease [Chloroflexota bacterium]|nr:ribonuclease [Chloroflexota bacterium]
MFELYFLGTSASAPSVQRGLPAQIVIHNEHRFLVDCGEGTQRQILRSRLGFRKLNRLLITHSHLDHILGIGGLVSTFLRWEAMEELEIYAGKTALERIEDLLFRVVIRGARPPFPIKLIPIHEGVIIEEKGLQIKAFPVNHRGPDCFGFAFEEEGKRPFLAEKAEELAIPQGPWRRDLVNGQQTTLPDGRTIDPEQVLGDFETGTKFVIVGDTGETASLVEHCRRADGLVIEGTYLKSEADMAHQFSHLTAEDAALLAKEAEVRKLFITHISRRYRDKDVEKEAQSVFPNSTVAHDFDSFMIKND